MARDEMTAERIQELETAHIVIAAYQSGEIHILKGEDILKDIAESKVSEKLLTMQIPVANTTQVEILAAALQVIEQGNMDEPTAQKAADMFNSATPLIIEGGKVPDGGHRTPIIPRRKH